MRDPRKFRVKFWLSLISEPVEHLLAYAQDAEELGYDGVILADHIVIKDGPHTGHAAGDPVPADYNLPDPLLSFAAMAAVTTRLKFLTGVYVAPLRDPFALAKQVGTLMAISQGRFVFGAGVGWLREEFETIGQDFSNRGKRMDEILGIARDFWEDGYAERDGSYYDFPRSGMFPVPSQRVPIWIGGHSIAAARRAANHDGYMPMHGLNAETRAEFKYIDELRREMGLTGPFERMSGASGIDGPAQIQKMEEVDGITSLNVFAWPYGDRSVSFEDKRVMAAQFSKTVIRRISSA